MEYKNVDCRYITRTILEISSYTLAIRQTHAQYSIIYKKTLFTNTALTSNAQRVYFVLYDSVSCTWLEGFSPRERHCCILGEKSLDSSIYLFFFYFVSRLCVYSVERHDVAWDVTCECRIYIYIYNIKEICDEFLLSRERARKIANYRSRCFLVT